MTSRPPPRTNSTRSRPSVSTSRNSMSIGHQVKETASGPKGTQEVWASIRTEVTWNTPPRSTQSNLTCYPPPHCWPLHKRIQFSSPSLFLGGPGMFSRTRRASWERVTMTSLSFTAVCMRRTLDWSLQVTQLIMGPTPGPPTELVHPPPQGPNVAGSLFVALTA